MALTHGELFAGISGFGQGFERHGIETKWHVEIDKTAQSVLRRHYPNTLLLDDVRTVGAHNLPPVDIITFGSPCQDLSVAGRRKGLAGERSGLFYEAIRIIGELKPTFAIWENVPGAFSSNNGRDFAYVLAAFLECGARDIAWATLDAQYFGVAQRRRRVFVVADFAGERAGEILFVPESGTEYSEASREARQGTAAAVIKGAAIGRQPHNGPQWGEYLTDDTCYTLNATEVHAVVGTLAASGAGTERPAGQGNELDTNGVRRLTPQECELLQGFPDGWTEYDDAGGVISDSARYRMLGNAVCANVAEWLGKRITALAGAVTRKQEAA